MFIYYPIAIVVWACPIAPVIATFANVPFVPDSPIVVCLMIIAQEIIETDEYPRRSFQIYAVIVAGDVIIFDID